MKNLAMSNILRFVVLIVLQVLMLNYVYLGGYMLPFIYILGVLMLPTRMGKVSMLLVAFAAGALVDIFCNIPGFHTFSSTLLAFARILFGNRMLTRGELVDIDVPGLHTVPFQQFAVYLFVMTMVYSMTYFLLETFSFGNFWWTMLTILLSTLVTWILLMLCQLLMPQKRSGKS